jgi:hypothetical protein
MDILERRIAPGKCGVRPDAVGINGIDTTEEQYCIEIQGKLWTVIILNEEIW